MTAVVIALLPAAGFGIYNFGPRALAVMAVTIASTVLTELLFGWLWKKKITISDMSAVVTGLLLALNLPVSIPLWMAALGGVFAILVVKLLFGGLGQNFMNPALDVYKRQDNKHHPPVPEERSSPYQTWNHKRC